MKNRFFSSEESDEKPPVFKPLEVLSKVAKEIEKKILQMICLVCPLRQTSLFQERLCFPKWPEMSVN